MTQCGQKVFSVEGIKQYRETLGKIASLLGSYLFPYGDREKAAQNYRRLHEADVPSTIYEMVREIFPEALHGESLAAEDAVGYIRHHFEYLYTLLFAGMIKYEVEMNHIRETAATYLQSKDFQRMVCNFRPQKGALSYILTSARNYLWSLYRSAKHSIFPHKNQTVPISTLSEKFGDEYENVLQVGAYAVNNTSDFWDMLEENALVLQVKEMIWDKVSRMKKYQRACVYRDYFGCSVNDLVKWIGCGVSTLKSAMSRERKGVRRKFEAILYQVGHTVRENYGYMHEIIMVRALQEMREEITVEVRKRKSVVRAARAHEQ